MRASDKWLARGARLVRGPLRLAVGLGISAGLLVILQTYLLVEIISGVLFGHRQPASLSGGSIALLLVIAVRVAVQYGSSRAGYYCAVRVKRQVRADLVARLSSLGPVGLADEHAGEIASTVVDGVEALEPYYARYLPQRAVGAVLPFLFLAIAYPADWLSGLILTVTAVCIPVLMVLIGEEARARNQARWTALSAMGARFLDTIRGLTTLKLFGAARSEAETIRKLSDEHRIATMNVVSVAFASSLMLELVTTISIALVAVTAGFRLLSGRLDFHTAYFILLLAPEFYQPLRNMGTHHHARMAAAAAAERIYALVGDGATSIREVGNIAPGTNTEKVSLGRAPSIELDNVRFSYAGGGAHGDSEILRGLTLRIDSGEAMAIVGKSGAGKSTLIHLLLGFVSPDSGRILMDAQEPPYRDVSPGGRSGGAVSTSAHSGAGQTDDVSSPEYPSIASEWWERWRGRVAWMP